MSIISLLVWQQTRSYLSALKIKVLCTYFYSEFKMRVIGELSLHSGISFRVKCAFPSISITWCLKAENVLYYYVWCSWNVPAVQLSQPNKRCRFIHTFHLEIHIHISSTMKPCTGSRKYLILLRGAQGVVFIT